MVVAPIWNYINPIEWCWGTVLSTPKIPFSLDIKKTFWTYKQCTNHIFSDISSLEHSCSASAWYKDATPWLACVDELKTPCGAKQMLLGRSCRSGMASLGSRPVKHGLTRIGRVWWSLRLYLEVWLKSLAGSPRRSGQYFWQFLTHGLLQNLGVYPTSSTSGRYPSCFPSVSHRFV